MTEPTQHEPDFLPLASQIATSSAFVTRLLGRVAGQGRSAAAWRVLSTVDRNGAQRVGDLASHERIAQPTMTGLVGRLEREGLVQRTSDPNDGRAALVAITARGHRELESYRARATAALSLAMSEMSERELRTLREANLLYDRMIASLESQLG